MGVVYAAYDRERKETVALKTLLHAEASLTYRFKKEFRTLADVAHPNLVSLYELIVEGDQCFFTMELVEGSGFLEYVRPGNSLSSRNADSGSAHTLTDLSTLPGSREETLRTACQFNLHRLLSASQQLAEGVYALHKAGKVHRDLKSSNVMVTSKGRVVILDFGLARELTPTDTQQSIERGIAGTVAYMAPEQARGVPATEASDWYALGVILYEALSGRLPFTGSTYEILTRKQNEEPLPPDHYDPDAPGDLVHLCMALLAQDPARRPSGPEVLRLFGSTSAFGTLNRVQDSCEEPALVGRQSYLTLLEEAFSNTLGGRSVSVYVHGPSGIGKTTLVRHFVDRLRRENRAIVLAGQCYERESVPYKALDGIVDSLSKYLSSLPRSSAEALMPRGVRDLSRLFPVLRRVEAIVNAPRRAEEFVDPWALRRRAFDALRELLARISDRHALVLFIDDLQWADEDSTALLLDLLGRPTRPPFFCCSTFVARKLDPSHFLKFSSTAREATLVGKWF